MIGRSCSHHCCSRTSVLPVGQLPGVPYRQHPHLALGQTDHRAAGAGAVDLVAEPVDGVRGQAGAEDPVERGRRAALLGLAEDHLAGVEQALALLLEQPAQELAGVHRAGPLVHHREEEPLPDPEAGDHPLDVVGQLLERDALLVQVDPHRAPGQPTQQGQVAAEAAHRLHDEAATGRGAGLPHAIDGVDDQVERAVGAHRQLRVGDVVVDGGREADRRDLGRRDTAHAHGPWCAPPRTRPSRR